MTEPLCESEKIALTRDPLPVVPPERTSAPHFDSLTPRKAIVLLVVIALSAAATLLLTLLIPENVYTRYQQPRDSVMFHASWIFERINNDPAPIDVAVVGASHLEAAASPTVLSDSLTARLGRPVHAVNLSLVSPGWDYTYIVVRNLLRKHPEVKVLVLSADGGAMFSHPLFKSVANVDDIIDAPLLINIKYFDNLLFIPYRQISYGVQSLLPQLFGTRSHFSSQAYLGSELDRSLGYRAPTGETVNGDQHAAPAVLDRQSREIVENDAKGANRYLRYLPIDEALAGERVYVKKITTLCRQTGTRLLFVNLPLYGARDLPNDTSFYARYGDVLYITDVADRADLYWNGGHLNRSGALIASKEMAQSVARLLQQTR